MNNKSTEHRNNKTSKIIYGMILNMAIHVFLTFRTYMDMLIDWAFSWVWEGEKRPLPALEKRHQLLTLSAVELASMIRNKQLKSEDLVRITIERIRIVNPIINAVTDERFDEALEEAREIDRKIAAGLPDEYFKKKPFLGVPFSAKETHAVRGMKHTLGLACRRGVRADEDAECVRLVREAGGVALTVTNVPELNKWQEARNPVYGQTNNPFHSGRTPGGSSGGEAALAAALAMPISICSDIGGSTRMPAFYCGLFGHNPTAGHTNLKGSVFRSGEDPTMASIGFVSKHCSDLAPLTKVVAADRAPALQLDREVDVKTLRYYYCETAKDLRVSPICKELRQAMNDVVSHLATVSGSAPEAYSHAGFNQLFPLWRHAMTKEGGNFALTLTNYRGEASGLKELGKKLIGQSEYTLAAILKLLDEQVVPPVNKQWAEQLTQELRDDLLSKLGSDGVLVFPSAPQPAPYHYAAYLRPYNFGYWGIFNVLQLPATQVPLGLSPAGIPLGVQVVAAPRQDALCLAVARELERRFGGYVPPCTVLK